MKDTEIKPKAGRLFWWIFLCGCIVFAAGVGSEIVGKTIEPRYDLGVYGWLHVLLSLGIRGIWQAHYKLIVTGILACILAVAVLYSLHRQLFRKAERAGKIMTVCIFAVGIMLLCVNGHSLWNTLLAEREIARVRTELRETRYILHAGGEIEDAKGKIRKKTNSKEALQNLYGKNVKFLEMDLALMEDGHIVCCHAWDELFVDGKACEGEISIEEFRRAKLKGGLTPAEFSDILALMDVEPDMYLVTDVKENNVACIEEILREAPEMRDRLIVQIYSPEEYDAIKILGVRNIIFTLYTIIEDYYKEFGLEYFDEVAVETYDGQTNLLSGCSEMSVDNLNTFSLQHDLVGIAFPRRLSETDGEWVREACEQLIAPMYIHTVNARWKQGIWFERGAEALYTDNMWEVAELE